MPVFYQPIDLAKNELRNAAVQNLGSAPSSPVKGQIYFDSTANILYWWNGSGWVAAQGGAGAVPATTVTTQAIGDAPVVGALTTYAREDHKHGEPAFGGVVGESNFGSAATAGVAATISRADHAHGNPALSSTQPQANQPGAGSAIGSLFTAAKADHTHGWSSAIGALDMVSQQIINLLDPALAQDGATKNYVDNSVAGLTWKSAVRAGTTANITLSATQTIDGVAVIVGDRVLVKNQTTASGNGIYVVAAGAWARSTDADAPAELLNAAMYIEEGTTLADTQWVCTTNAPITIGTTSITFVQFSGGGTYTAGNGLTLAGNVFAVGAGTGILSTASTTSVDTSVIATVASVTAAVTGMAKKFAAALAGTASPETITHNLNTRDIMLTVLNGASPYTAVEVDWDATTVNTATIRYNPTLGAGYRAVVVG
jgi:hypothetical protein